jgi:large subunit ribosomal protein L15
VIDPDAMVSSGLIRKSGRGAVKVLGDGAVAHALTVRAHKVSEGAKQKLEAAGGRVEVLPARAQRAAK